MIGEAALRRVELKGRHADVEQNTVRGKNAVFGRDAVHLGKIPHRNDGAGVFGKPRPHDCDRVRIAVDREELPRCEALEDGAGMPAAARSAVYIDALRLNAEGLDRLLEQNRLVVENNFLHNQILRACMSLRSCSLDMDSLKAFQRSLSQISAVAPTPITVTSFVRPAWRRSVGLMRMRPCLSGVT